MKTIYSLIETPFPGSTLYVPTSDSFAGILLLHGSEGGRYGWNDCMAEFFAAHGYGALAYS